jgi:hypothetical protein
MYNDYLAHGRDAVVGKVAGSKPEVVLLALGLDWATRGDESHRPEPRKSAPLKPPGARSSGGGHIEDPAI